MSNSPAPASVFVLVAAANVPEPQDRVIAVFDTHAHAEDYADTYHGKDYWRIEQHEVRTSAHRFTAW